MHSDHTHSRFRRNRNLCLGITIAAVILVVLILVILAFTVFKAKKPIIVVGALTLDDLNASLNLARFSVNLTLGVDLSVENPNRVGFTYSNSTAYLNYRGNRVGESPLPAGEISARQTKPMNLTLTVMADRLLSNASELFSDVRSGALPLNSFVRISGKVKVANVLKVHVVSSTTCDFTVFLSNRTVSDRSCRYKTQL